MGKDLYSILGVSKSATKAEIKSAYHKLARKYHPDVNKDNPSAAEKFKEISAAYDILGDDEKRKKYDNNEIDGDGKPTGFGAGFGGAYGGGNPFGQGGFYSSSGGQNANFDFSSIFGDDIFSAFGGGRGRLSGLRRRRQTAAQRRRHYLYHADRFSDRGSRRRTSGDARRPQHQRQNPFRHRRRTDPAPERSGRPGAL